MFINTLNSAVLNGKKLNFETNVFQIHLLMQRFGNKFSTRAACFRPHDDLSQ